MNRQLLRSAFRTSLPVLAGYLFLGIGFGILLRSAGYGALWAFSMSVLMYAGAMQYVGVSLLSGGASLLTAALTTLTVNARHLFYGISMLSVYRDSGVLKPYLAFSLTDETYSLLCDGHAPPGVDPDLYRFLVSLFDHLYWILGCVSGNILGSLLPFSTSGIEFSMTALFLTSFTEQWLSSTDRLPALVGLLVTLLCLLLFGSSHFLIPSMLLITLILMLLRRREGRS